ERLAGIVDWVWRLRDIDPPRSVPAPAPPAEPPKPGPRPEDPRALWPEHHYPPDYARYYGFPEQYDGAGQCVGVLSVIGGYRRSELETFFAALELPVPEIIDIGEEGLERSEEHTSVLQSRENLVCRLLLEKKNIVRPFIVICQS